MSKANIFLLLPETNKTSNWSLLNEPFENKTEFSNFIKCKISEIRTIDIENYQGFYDNENFNNFFELFDTFEEFYPSQEKRSLRRLIETTYAWQNWRINSQQNTDTTYTLYNLPISNHTLTEIAERKKNTTTETFALLNNRALNINEDKIKIKISRKIIEIDNVKNTIELQNWFSQNRIPQRHFHIIEKHGENRHEPINWHGRLASPLRCSEAKATELLKKAIGDTIDELFAYDTEEDEFIVYKYENDNPQNLYHGYHVPKISNELPEKIKIKLLQ